MGIKISKDVASTEIRQAFKLALDDVKLPSEWLEISRLLRKESVPLSYTPALGTGILARACSEDVDALSLKATYAENSYSARTLCHAVLVKMSVELGFDLRASGREPLNNQPFFRYDHYSKIDRIKSSARPHFELLKSALARLNRYTRDEARLALAAFLRVCAEAAQKKARRVGGGRLPEVSLITLTQKYVSTGADVPRKLQACVAAGLDIAHKDVLSRRLNDPSRDAPGDVHVSSGEGIHLAVEVRGKPVTVTELEQFVRSVAGAGIGRAMLVVDSVNHTSLSSVPTVAQLEDRYDVLVTIIESISDFLRWAFSWSGQSVGYVVSQFPDIMHKRMVEIEVRETELQRWINLFSEEAGESLDASDTTTLDGVRRGY